MSLYSLAKIYDEWPDAYSIVPVTLHSAWDELRNSTSSFSDFLQRIVSLQKRRHVLQVCTYTRVDALYTEALAIYQRVLPANDLGLAYLLQQTAGRKRDPTQRALLYQQALKVVEQRFGPESEEVIPYLENLTVCYMLQGNYSASEVASQRINSIATKKYGLDNGVILLEYENRSRMYQAYGDYEAAVSCDQFIITVEERLYGLKDYHLCEPLYDLENLYRMVGNQRQQERIRVRRKLIMRLYPHYGMR